MSHLRAIGWIPRLAVVTLLCLVACGDDDTSSPTAGSGAGGAGGAGGNAGKSGKSGAGGAGRSGSGGQAAAAGMTGTMLTCTETPSTAPVTCGGETCTAPSDFAMNPCVVPCCVTVDGKERCASKSTATGFTTECVLQAEPDTSCPNVDAMGTPLMGCCNAEQKKCGIISTLRPGCITESMLVMLPNPLQECTPPATGGDDAGTPDAG